MGILRSDIMKRGTLVIPSHRAHKMVDMIGRSGYVQICDMNETSLNRQYKQYIQRIEEMERKIRFLFDLIDNLTDVKIVCGNVNEFLTYDDCYQFEKVENSLQTIYKQFIIFRDNNHDLIQQKNQTMEEKHVVQLSIKYFSMANRSQNEIFLTSSDVSKQALLSEIHDNEELGDLSPSNKQHLHTITNMAFSAIAGVIDKVDQWSMERMIFYTTRGNSYSYFEQITDDTQDSTKPLPLSVFVIYHQGSNQSVMAEKIRNICISYGCRLFPWETNPTHAQQHLQDLTDKLLDKERAVKAYENYFKNEISALLQVVKPSQNSLLEDWRLFCLKEKSIYTHLDLFEGTDLTLRANCWFPEEKEDEIRWLLNLESKNEHVSSFLLTDNSPTHIPPPTYNRTSEFTDVFQFMVDLYGIPRYREANPAIFAIITLPFLFAVMFGDIGHGVCVCLFALFLTQTHKEMSKKNEFISTLGWSRYLFLLMGGFSIFTGLIYNEFFSIGVSIFSSGWLSNGGTNKLSYWKPSNHVYPFGMDPKWRGATNELVYVNSFKMKFSVIMAFFHMTAGVVLKGLNCLHFNEKFELIFDFIPQIILLFSFVGYMNFLIIYKWLTPNDSSYNKPSIINLMVKLCLYQDLSENEIMFTHHQFTQHLFLVLIGGSIFTMMLLRPIVYYIYKKWIDQRRFYQALTAHTHTNNLTPPYDDQNETIMDVCVNHWMESIEFILSVVSNTASYLRLWALSLAHQQLSLIFFDYTILLALNINHPIVMIITLFVNVTIFASVTVIVMLGMELTECLLHSLRLQWVEFQNKFYKADGYKFIAFDFNKILSEK